MTHDAKDTIKAKKNNNKEYRVSISTYAFDKRS